MPAPENSGADLPTQHPPGWLTATGLFIAALTAGCGFLEASSVTRDHECPVDNGQDRSYVVAVELSPSERQNRIFDDRISVLEDVTAEAADCESQLTVAVLENSRTTILYNRELTSSLGTEVARDNEVPEVVEAVSTEVRQQLAQYAGDDPTAPWSDPGSVFRFLHERLDALDSNVHLEATVLSDGVTQTADADLNQPLDSTDIELLAELIAPPVNLEGRVSIEWYGLGVTADTAGPPSGWIDYLKELWQRICLSRGASACLINTTTRG